MEVVPLPSASILADFISACRCCLELGADRSETVLRFTLQPQVMQQAIEGRGDLPMSYVYTRAGWWAMLGHAFSFVSSTDFLQKLRTRGCRREELKK